MCQLVGGFNSFRVVEDMAATFTQGSSFLATLGWMIESFQDVAEGVFLRWRL
jgi:hypothetical protein